MNLPPAKSLLLFALLVAGLVNVHALVLNVRAHARFRESTFSTIRARVAGVRATVAQRMALGGVPDLDSALRYAMAEGGGFADLELGIFRELGKVTPQTPVATTVHSVQLVDEALLPMLGHDSPLDYIATEAGVIETRTAMPRPRAR